MTWNRLLGSTPINRTAAVVTGQSKADAPREAFVAQDTQHWKAPPPCKPVSDGQPDLTGARFGRFTVLGYLGRSTPNQKSCWLVRCVCGDYESRKAKAILNPANNEDSCLNCRRHAYIVKGGKR